ncbi:ATP-binding protein [Haliangium sp.]|uniref:HAMP domain-containing sensor histidine kinase n=1 Tax=Haliangium sp. TaxID=2663208 RepID=UPI003D0AC160
MKLGIRAKLFLASVALISLFVLAAGLYLQRELRHDLDNSMETVLWHQAEAVRAFLESDSDALSPPRLRGLARRLDESLNTHIDIVTPDGHMLSADDDDETPRLAPAHLPTELTDALHHGRGVARRHSVALDAPMLYVALPFQHPHGPGLLRVSRPLTELQSSVAQLQGPLLVAGLIGLVGALLVSVLGSQLLARTLRKLADSARAIAERGAHQRLAVDSSDEIGGLAGSLNRLADDIEITMTALATEKARFKAVLEGMSEAVITLDAERRITLINPAAMRLLGVDDEPLDRPLIELIRAPALHDLLADADRAGSCEFELSGPPGPRRIQAKVSPPLGGNDWILVMHDVTDIRKLETVRRDFVANVSHELRTPVTIIRANAETLLDGAMNEPVHGQRILEALHRNAERLSRLVDDLLDLSRLEANRYRIEHDDLDVGEAVAKAMESIERAAQAKAIELHVDITAPMRVRADDKALDQILVNYLDNAVKYTPHGGRVRVSARLVEQRVRIEVTDDGPGISPQHRKRIFERFYRVDPGRSRDMGGTGLGLSIVKHLADSLDGDAGMEPATPKGSTFWVTLPRA